MNQIFQKDTIHSRREDDKVSKGCTQGSDSTHEIISSSSLPHLSHPATYKILLLECSSNFSSNFISTATLEFDMR